MSETLRVVFYIILWIAVPAILVIAIIKTSRLSKNAGDEKHASAARSGFWGGIILSLITLIYQVGFFLKTGFPDRDLFGGFDLWLVLTSAVVGYLLSIGGKKAVPTKLIGFVVLVLTFLASYALIHYLLIRTHNDVVLSLVLGATLGVLVHYAAGPATFGIRRFSGG